MWDVVLFHPSVSPFGPHPPSAGSLTADCPSKELTSFRANKTQSVRLPHGVFP